MARLESDLRSITYRHLPCLVRGGLGTRGLIDEELLVSLLLKKRNRDWAAFHAGGLPGRVGFLPG